MNIQQLRYLDEVVKHSFNVSDAAKALNTSQPGVSKQLRLLEEELRTDVVVRRRNRLVALTEQGTKILRIARHVLWELDNIRRVGEEAVEQRGMLVIATTHMHARYSLLPTIARFRQRFGSFAVCVKQGMPDQIGNLVANGDADIGISTVPANPNPELTRLPCYKIYRSVFVPVKHPLIRKRRISMQDLAAFPFINADSSYLDAASVMTSFHANQIDPQVVLSAADVGVIKAYVQAGLGIAILPSISLDVARDKGLRALPLEHLFGPAISYIWLNRRSYLRSCVSSFVEMLSPAWTRALIENALQSEEVPDDDLAIRPPQRGTAVRRRDR